MNRLRIKLLKGMLDLYILRLIKEKGSVHGYKVIKDIRKRYKVYFAPSIIYPLINNLERKGYLKSEWCFSEHGRPIKVYKLTLEGEKRLVAGQVELKMVATPLYETLRH